MSLRVADLFAGAGGASCGAAAAGANVVFAANHWPRAVEVHEANHPNAAHECQDLQQYDFHAMPDHDLLWASPACQGHSRARGKDQPHHDKTRATAWSVVSAAEAKRPQWVVVENVPEFRKWVLFATWVSALEALGYRLTSRVLDAADFGVPQHRRRLFVLATNEGWQRLPAGSTAYKPASTFLDFDAGRWSDVHKPGRAESTLRRWDAGRDECGSRFLMPYYSMGSGLTGRPITRPIGTITTRDRWALVDGNRMRMLTVAECQQAMGFPASYDLSSRNHRDSIHLLGNAVCPPVAEAIIRSVAA